MTPKTIGETLRRHRISQGARLDYIGQRTRIPVRYLEAIEAGHFELLPGLIFTRNFVRQYCEAVELEPDELLDALPKAEEVPLPLPSPPVSVRFQSAEWRNNPFVSSAIWLVLATIAGVVAYAHYNQPTALAADQTQQASVAAATTNQAQEARPQPQSPETPPPVAMTPVATAPAAAATASGAPVYVKISATQPAWISLTADGKNTYSGTLQPNETKEISANEQIKLVAGNAGGLTVSLNGKPLEPLGVEGQVRVLRLTAEGPEFLPTNHPPPPADDPL